MESLADAPPFPVFVAAEPGPSEKAAGLAKFVESFASVIAGLHEIYTPETGERVMMAFHDGTLGYSVSGGPALLWLSLRSLSARHGGELRAAAARRAAAIARLSKYVAADVISEAAGRGPPACDAALTAPSDFELAGSAHTERGVFRCGAASEALHRTESVARMGGCWAVLLTPPAVLSGAAGPATASSLEVVAITGAEEDGEDEEPEDEGGIDLAGDCGRDAGVPWLLPSQVRRLRDRAALLLNPASAGSNEGPRPEARAEADPHLQLLRWGPAVLCVGAVGAAIESVLRRAGGDSTLEARHGGPAVAPGHLRPADVAQLIAANLAEAVAPPA